jgi:hypothetical protein
MTVLVCFVYMINCHLRRSFILYSLCFKIKVTFGHKPRYEIKVMFGEIFFKLCQTNWNVAIINVNVVVDELPSQITSLHLFDN